MNTSYFASYKAILKRWTFIKTCLWEKLIILSILIQRPYFLPPQVTHYCPSRPYLWLKSNFVLRNYKLNFCCTYDYTRQLLTYKLFIFFSKDVQLFFIYQQPIINDCKLLSTKLMPKCTYIRNMQNQSKRKNYLCYKKINNETIEMCHQL